MPDRRHLLVLHSSDEQYGADRILLRVLRELRGLVDPVVVLPSDTNAGWLSRQLHADGIRVVRLPVPVLRRRYASPVGVAVVVARTLAAIPRLWWLGRRVRAVAVHTNTAAIPVGGLVAAGLGVPSVWHVHEIIERPRWLGRVVGRLSGMNVTRVVAISEAVRRQLLADGGRTTDVIRNPAPSWHTRRDPDQPERVVMIGRVNGWKGHDVFLAAAADLIARGTTCQFRVVGGPVPGRTEPYERMLEQARAVDPAGEQLVIVGEVEDVREEIEAAAIVVLPSTGPEPLNITALEAMALGRPVIASRSGGLPEVVKDGVTGRLVPPGDPFALASAMAELIEDPAQRSTMGDAGRSRARTEFSTTKYGEQWRQLYRELLPDRRLISDRRQSDDARSRQ